ncbi:MAG TPA: hypothetical protein DEB06_06980 [Phycisphaerales bacterium]|nr:hypothetical protein [Phycisphaerales bacterium]
MRAGERVLVYGGLVLAVALGLRASVVSPALARAPREAGGGREAPAPVIAVCAVNPLVDDLMDSDRFKPDREELEKTLREELLEPINEELGKLQKDSEAVDRSNEDEVRKLRDRYVELQREGARRQGEIARRVEEKVAAQLVECYGLVRESAIDIAEDLGFNYLLASTGADEELEKETVVALTRDMSNRPVLLSPKGTDITEDVRVDLKLK